ncbi:MAG: hypothetical protein IT236_06315 [Bacteroidia bacterium]|nr:hypothetical protein [Bacteroidia bacterium]
MKTLIILFFLACLMHLPYCAFAQSIDPIRFEKTARSTRKITNPKVLVATITKGKSGEKEKFDAIFNWVVNNIDYNYSIYFSSGGVSPMSVKQILKYKSGVCLHYAFLMDTLCALADITNVTVLGYAKDELFDVKDSLYMDNHAWNAVKLNGLWYLYDVTFSSGEVFYRYTKFSQAINYIIRHWIIGYKQVVIKPKPRFFFFNDCDGDTAAERQRKPIIKTVSYVKFKLLYHLLQKFKPRFVRDYKKNMTADYYLTEPELFAIQHFPDNPVWSLTATKSMQEFEGDSAFYYLNDSSFAHQNRQGRTCVECDAEIYMDALNWSLNMRKRSLKFNPHNRFITSACEYCIALVKFNAAKKAKDSLTKVTLLDTSRTLLNEARASMRQSVLNLRANYVSQKDKNMRKVYALMDENKAHSEFIKNQIARTNQETRNIRSLEDEINLRAKKTFRRSFTLNRLKKGKEVEISHTPSEAVLEQLKRQHQQTMLKADSLTRMFEDLKTDFSNLLPPLSDNLWKQVQIHDSLLRPIISSTNLRTKLLDNFKIEIVETRKRINWAESFYKLQSDSGLSRMSEKAFDLAHLILNVMDDRNRTMENGYKLKKQLIKYGALEPEKLDEHTTRMQQLNDEDFCWLRGKNSMYLRSLFHGFVSLKGRQREFEGAIRTENRVEGIRSRMVGAELSKRRKKYSRILKGNRRAVFRKAIEVKDYKKSYLDKLRKKAKKEKRRAKKKK